MKAYIQQNNSAHQSTHVKAIKAGFDRHGIRYEVGPRSSAPKTNCDFVVVWGFKPPQLMKDIRARGMDLLIMERGYLPDRFVFSSLGWNGLNNRATFPACADTGQRFETLWPGLIKPWRTGGDFVLLCGQCPQDAALYGVNFDTWAQRVTSKLREQRQRVIFRPHPFMVKTGRAFRVPMGAKQSRAAKLEQDLEGASLCVTYNSNSGVESVLFGTPTVTMDRGAMAWDVTTHDVDAEPIRPDREAWAHRLSWCNWQLGEISSGQAWESVRTVMDRYAIA